MSDYSIVFARSARKELQALDPPVARRVLERIEALASEPRPAGSRKLRGSNALWRIRVDDYRVLYALDDVAHVVDVVVVRHRRDAYRR